MLVVDPNQGGGSGGKAERKTNYVTHGHLPKLHLAQAEQKPRQALITGEAVTPPFVITPEPLVVFVGLRMFSWRSPLW